jgi:hypothetical protein
MTGWFNVHWSSMNQRQRGKFGKDLEFDRWDFEKWIIDNNFKKFYELFFKWANSGYITDLCPSIDRINCYEEYNYTNIQLITWLENKEKGWTEKKEMAISAMNDMTKKAVIKLNIQGEYLDRYESLSEAGRKNDMSTGDICNCCQGKRKTAKGYRWIYE